LGATVKLAEAVFSAPPAGPVNVKLLATEFGVTEFDAADAALTPSALAAVTVQLYAVPFVRPVTVIGLPAPLAL
jgi:hypothetical protein